MNRRRMPRGFRLDHDDGVICPDRECTCCDACASAHEEIVNVVGRHYWVANPTERAELLAMMAADARAAS